MTRGKPQQVTVLVEDAAVVDWWQQGLYLLQRGRPKLMGFQLGPIVALRVVRFGHLPAQMVTAVANITEQQAIAAIANCQLVPTNTARWR